MVTSLDGLLPIKSHNHVMTWNHYISTTAVPIATKFRKLVTCHEWLPPIMLRHSLVTWSCEIVWQTITIISLLSQYLWSQNLEGWWLPWLPFTFYFFPNNHVMAWFFDITWQTKNISPLQQSLWSQNLTDDNLLWVISTQKNPWPYNQVVLQDHVMN